MGIERITVSAKIDPENRDWLKKTEASFYPFTISRSSLINSCLTLLRLTQKSGEISITPAVLALCNVDPAAAMALAIPATDPRRKP